MSPISCEIFHSFPPDVWVRIKVEGGDPQEEAIVTQYKRAPRIHELPRGQFYTLSGGDKILLPSGAKLEAKHQFSNYKGVHKCKFSIEDHSEETGEVVVQFEKISTEGIKSKKSSPRLKAEVSETPKSIKRKPIVIYNRGNSIAEIIWEDKEEK